jgi:hypothetical protein
MDKPGEVVREEPEGCISMYTGANFLFLWGYVKNIIYQVKINNLQHMKAHTKDALATVTPKKLQET